MAGKTPYNKNRSFLSLQSGRSRVSRRKRRSRITRLYGKFTALLESDCTLIRELKQQRRPRLQKCTYKVNSHYLELYHAYSISFTSSKVGKCFWSWILKDCIKVQEKKRKLLSCVPVLDKTWIQAFSRCSRATTAKKCAKKAWCTCIVVVLLIKPIAFLPFSLPSASSLLKLPIIESLLTSLYTFLLISIRLNQ